MFFLKHLFPPSTIFWDVKKLFHLKTFCRVNLKNFTFYIAGHEKNCEQQMIKEKLFLAIPFYKSAKESQTTTTNPARVEKFSRKKLNFSRLARENFSLFFNILKQGRRKKWQQKLFSRIFTFDDFGKVFLPSSVERLVWCSSFPEWNEMRFKVFHKFHYFPCYSLSHSLSLLIYNDVI